MDGDFDTKSQKDSKGVLIEPGCIACGACAFNAPDVFEVTDRSRVKTDADFEKNAGFIEKAAAQCPVQVIKIVRKND